MIDAIMHMPEPFQAIIGLLAGMAFYFATVRS
jgi:hypothetical protein